MDSRSIEEISLNEVLENTVKSYDKVLSSHEEILAAKVSASCAILDLIQDEFSLDPMDFSEFDIFCN